MLDDDRKPAGLRLPAVIGTRIIRRVIWTLGFFKFVDVTIIGRENVPKKGPAILAINHTSWLDAVVVWGSLRRPVIALAMAEIWSMFLLKHIARLLGQIPVIRNDRLSGVQATNAGKQVLRHGGVVAIFPQGGISSPNEPQKRYKTGAARMSDSTKVPVTPVSLIGVNEVLPLARDRTSRKKFFLGKKVTVVFGEPIDPANYASTVQMTAEIQRRIEEAIEKY